jgi:hypothetical protein
VHGVLHHVRGVRNGSVESCFSTFPSLK